MRHPAPLAAAAFALPLALVLALSGCGGGEAKKAEAPAPDIVDRMFKARAAAQAFRPPAVRSALAFLDSLADSTTALAVWVEMRSGSEGAIAGLWRGDTTFVQLAGGTGLRGIAREGKPGTDLLRLAGTEARSFLRAPDREPPYDGRVRIWVVTPAGLRLREEGARAFFNPDRRSSPFMQEARLLTDKLIGDVLEFEAGTSATLESLGVVPEHTATSLLGALGIDPQRMR